MIVPDPTKIGDEPGHTLRPFMVIVAVTVALVILVGFVIGVATHTLFTNVSDQWALIRDNAQREQQLLTTLRAKMGYGGFIHNFKNYVLRQDPLYLQRLESDNAALREALKGYWDHVAARFPPGHPDRRQLEIALSALEAVIDEYTYMIDIARLAAQKGRAPRETDVLVKVSDAPAIEAFAELERIWALNFSRETRSFQRWISHGVTGVRFLLVLAPLLVVALALVLWSLRRLRQAQLALRAANTALEEHRDTLQVKVDSATAELRRKSEELADTLIKEMEVNRLQRQFVATVSHEFRTPLTVIDGQAQRIARRHARMTPETLVESTGKIRQAVNYTMELMEQFLYSGRLDEGKLGVHPAPLDLADRIREIAARQHEMDPSHAFHLDLAGLPATVEADVKAVEHIFANLFSNAVKYSPGADRVCVTGRLADGRVTVAVRDFGIGIPADEVHLVFHRYHRAENVDGIRGTGIGLNLVKELVELHGGTISVDSTVGAGTVFTVSLPMEGSVPPENEKK